MYNEMFTMYNANVYLQYNQYKSKSSARHYQQTSEAQICCSAIWVNAVYPLTQSNKTDAMRSWINTKPNLNPILNHHVAIISADGCSSDMFIANPGVLRRPRSHIVEDEVVGHIFV